MIAPAFSDDEGTECWPRSTVVLGPVRRKNSWQLAEYAGHSAPHRLQHLLAGARWNADQVRVDVQAYVAERLGAPDGILIIDDTGFVKKAARLHHEAGQPEPLDEIISTLI